MNREEQFLWIVQTAVLANAVNIAGDPERNTKYRHVYSSTGVRIIAREAIRASTRMPEGMDVADAADEFCAWMFDNHRDSIKKDDPDAEMPSWFAR